MSHESEELNPAETNALRDWGASWSPPPGLRQSTRAALQDRGLFALRGRPAFRFRLAWVTGSAVAVAVAFFAGLGMRDAPSTAPPADPSGDLYMLLLYESETYQAPQSAEAHRERAREYGSWARELAVSGRFVDGNELAEAGTWYRPSPEGPAPAAPRLDPERGRLAGYFVVEADNDEAIVAVMQTCPHLRHGGSIEIRRVGSG